MKYSFVSALLLGSASAFPAAFVDDPRLSEDSMNLAMRTLENIKRQSGGPADAIPQDALGISKAQTNCGPLPCPTFSEEDQEVSVSGEHAYQSPGPGDIRGPCPGLNAAANHGYLPRNGIASIEETVSGLGALYNMAAPLAVALSAYAIAIDGNIVEGVWSIGGPLPEDELTSALLGTGQGLSYSHNNYEGDGSIGRNDAYTNNGDAHSLNITKFENVYKVGGNDKSVDGRAQRFTLDKFRSRFEAVQDEAIASNPYYFTGAFSTFVVVPAAYNFVINFMSNHSQEEPNGYLDGYNFKSFFGVTGKPGSFKWLPGQERVPERWYRRPSYNQYTSNDVFEDVGIGYLAYPKTLRFGGNTGKPNSFVGLDLGTYTGGAQNIGNLFQGNNFACFAFNLAQQGIPAALKLPLDQVNKRLSVFTNAIGPQLAALGCPQLGKFDQGLLNQYPGRKYSPSGPATNY